MRIFKHALIVSLAAPLLFAGCGDDEKCDSANTAKAAASKIVYVVRHNEPYFAGPDVGHLDPDGVIRSDRLADVFGRTELTHVFSSHKMRAFETVNPTATAHGLTVSQLPALGSTLPTGETVDEDTSTGESLQPVIDAINDLPGGSRVLVAGHSATVLAIQAGIGVRVDPADPDCQTSNGCLAGTTKDDFSATAGGFDSLYTISISCTDDGNCETENVHQMRMSYSPDL